MKDGKEALVLLFNDKNNELLEIINQMKKGYVLKIVFPGEYSDELRKINLNGFTKAYSKIK